MLLCTPLESFSEPIRETPVRHFRNLQKLATLFGLDFAMLRAEFLDVRPVARTMHEMEQHDNVGCWRRALETIKKRRQSQRIKVDVLRTSE